MTIEIAEEIVSVLQRRTKNSIVIVDSPSGYLDNVETFVSNGINNRKFQSLLQSITLSQADLLADCNDCIDVALERFLAEVPLSFPDHILFIENLNLFLGGPENKYLDVYNLLAPILSRGQLKIVTTMSEDEYQSSIGGLSSLDRRFQKVDISR